MQLSQSDPLYPVQVELWRLIGLDPSTRSLVDAPLPACLAAARAVCLSAKELEQQLLSPQNIIQRPINPRNEAAALAMLLDNQQTVCGDSLERQQQLQDLLRAYQKAGGWHNSPQQPQAAGLTSFPENSPEAQLHRWALEQGAVSQVTPAVFGSSRSGGSGGDGSNNNGSTAHGLRGCAAAADIAPGSVVMSVPAKLLITYTTAAASDFGKALSELPGLDAETLAVVWTMVDRHEPESPHAPFWAALPAHFGTALSAPQAWVDLLKGCPLHQAAVEARTHVRQQFQALQQTFQVLLTAYAAYLQPGWFNEDAFLWAVELWYAYAIQVKFSDGNIQPALVPLASLINHSPSCPHIVHFSKVNPETRSLELKCFRPVAQQEQVFLSYGPLPNSQLLLFYGFCVPHNPFEEQVLEVQPQQVLLLLQQHTLRLTEGAQHEGPQQVAPQQEQQHSEQMAAKLQLLQNLQLPLRFTLTVQQPLPAGLLCCLRLLCADPAELRLLQQAVEQQSAAAAVAATPAGSSGGGGSQGKSKSKSKGKGTAGSSSSSGGAGGAASDPTSLKATQRRWAAAGLQAAVLGSAISSSNEAAAQAVLRQLLAAARAPYDTCLARLHKRRQLEAMLQQQKVHEQPPGAGFIAALEVYLHDVLGLFDACVAAAAQ